MTCRKNNVIRDKNKDSEIMYILIIFSMDREIESLKTREASKITLNSLQFKRNPRSIAQKLWKIQLLEDVMPKKV